MSKENDLKNFINKINNPLYLNLSLFLNFNDYIKKCDTDVRTSYNKYLRNYFKFERLYIIGPTEQSQLWDIWTSTNTRQNRPLNLYYEKINGSREEIKVNHWPIADYLEYTFPNCSLEFYAISKDDKIVAYLEIIISDKMAIVHSTLGHHSYLKFGIMKSLFVETIKLKWDLIDKFVYGSVDQKDYFKTDLLIGSK